MFFFERVSRLHAKIDWRHGNFVLTDVSSYGTWVRFGSNSMEFALRRTDFERALHRVVESGDRVHTLGWRHAARGPEILLVHTH